MAVAAAVAVAGVWIGLTAWTGKTYHLAPVLAAAAPAVVARGRGPVASPRVAFLAGAGVGVALGAWAALVALGIEPTATVVDRQPGGVAGEVVLGALAGAVGAAASPLLRRRRRGRARP